MLTIDHKELVNLGLRSFCCGGNPIWPKSRLLSQHMSHLCLLFFCQSNGVLTYSQCAENSQNKLLGDLKSPFIPLQIHKHYSLFSSLPQIACLAFLSFQYPLLLFKGLQGTEKNNATEVSFDSSAVPLPCLFPGGFAAIKH